MDVGGEEEEAAAAAAVLVGPALEDVPCWQRFASRDTAANK